MEREYRFTRICNLDGCDVEFKTNYKQKIFHEPACHDEYWRRIRSGTGALQKEVTKLRKEVQELKEAKAN